MSAIEWLAFASIAASGSACIVAWWAKSAVEKARLAQTQATAALMSVVASLDNKVESLERLSSHRAARRAER